MARSLLEYVAYDMPAELGATMRATATAAMDNAFGEVLPRGVTPIPQVFVFDRFGEQQLVGHIMCRGYERGPDAAQAVAHLGRIAAAVAGTDLLVTWEQADLDGTSPAGTALAILEAALDYHALTLVPFYRRTVGQESDGQPNVKVIPDQPTDTYEGAALPLSVHTLLHLWRTCLATYDWDYSQQVVADAVRSGYDIALGTPKG